MKPLAQCQLYTFVDTAYLHGRPPAEVARELCDGGADILQLRAKGCPEESVRHMAETLVPITRQAGVWLVINDHPRVAVETGAGFCHLGQEDFFDAGFVHVHDLISKWEGATPRGLKVGLSTHAPEQAVRALAAAPDYIAIGPVFATGTKPEARPVTLDYVRWAAAHVRAPWFAIGGINLDTLDAVLEAGARRVCVVSAILNAKSISQACQQFKNRLALAPLA